MKFYLAPYEERQAILPDANGDGGRPYGRYLPDEAMQSPIEMPVRDGGWNQWAIVATADDVVIDNEDRLIAQGADVKAVPSERSKGVWTSTLKRPPKGDTIGRWIEWHLKAEAVLSPSFDRFNKTMSTELWLGEDEGGNPKRHINRLWDVRRGDSHTRPFLATMQNSYQGILDQNDPGAEDRADKWLDRMTAKHGGIHGLTADQINARKGQKDVWELFLPPGKRNGHRGPIPHATSYSDDFNRADGGPGANWKSYNRASPYAENAPGAQIYSYTIERVVSNDVYMVYQSALSDDDAETWGRRAGTPAGNNMGPLSRAGSSSWGQQGYYCFQYGTTLYCRRADGGEGSIGSHASGSVTDWAKIYPNGSTIKAYNGGTGASPSWSERISATNTAWANGLYSGIGNWGTASLHGHMFDDWNTDDLAVAPSGPTLVELKSSERGMNRGVYTA